VEETDDEGAVLPNPDGGGGPFYVDKVRIVGLPKGEGFPTTEEVLAGLNAQPGYLCSDEELEQDSEKLNEMKLGDDVDASVVRIYNKHGRKTRRCLVTFTIGSQAYSQKNFIEVTGAKMLPASVRRQLEEERPKTRGPTVADVSRLKAIIEGWYQDHGWAYSYVSAIHGLEKGDRITFDVIEGQTSHVKVVHMDDQGRPLPKGQRGVVPGHVIERELHLEKGKPYNLEDGRRALRDVFALNLFDNVQVLPKQNPEKLHRIDVDVMVKERPMETTEVETEWQIAPGDSGRPGLVGIVPGGSLMYEHRYLGPKGHQLSASCNAPNLIAPGDELGFRVDWKLPYFRHKKDPKKSTLSASAFNARKISGVFIAGPGGEEVPSVFIDRTGAKASWSEYHGRKSKAVYSVVVEQVAALDEQGGVCTRGSKVVQTSQGAALDPTGPPTTLRPSGRDRLAFLQSTLTRDATWSLNNTTIGPRDVFQVEQGIGLGSFFNRFVLSSTRFIKLQDPQLRSAASPPVLVLHARCGNTTGDMASYDTFTLGGPNSLRGFNVGEVAACRRFVEAAVELRYPVFGRQLFAFYEHANDLGSSKTVRGNPTEYYRRPGSASSFGAGIKLGSVRAEWATEGDNIKKGHFFLRFGERF